MPLNEQEILVIGANGQLGKQLQIEFPGAVFTNRDSLDASDALAVASYDFSGIRVIINAAAWTKVDDADKPEFREQAKSANVDLVRNLAKVAHDCDITLIHISSDYVFDGTAPIHLEDETFSPLGSPDETGVYGQTKAEGDRIASEAPKHYILRTSWVIGDGNNFVRTMKTLADRGITPGVVDDQFGRLTFTEDIAAGIRHLLETHASYGTYNLSNEGETVSWADIAKRVYELSGKSADMVTPLSTKEYFAGKSGIAPRPAHSTLDLSKIKKAGFTPRNQFEALELYITELIKDQQKEVA